MHVFKTNLAGIFFSASYEALRSVINYVLLNINDKTKTQALWTKELLLLSNLLCVYQLSRTAQNLSVAEVIRKSNNQLAHRRCQVIAWAVGWGMIWMLTAFFCEDV